MANEIPAASAADSHFGFTKLVVVDLDRAHEFYTSVCGLVEQFRYQSDINGRPISEILYAPTQAGGAAFALLKFMDGAAPDTGEMILGFSTGDLDAFIARALAAGGRVTDPVREMEDLNLRVAFIEDGEGHLIEVVQTL